MRLAKMFEDVVSVYFEMMQNLLAQPSFGFSEEPATEVPAASGCVPNSGQNGKTNHLRGKDQEFEAAFAG
jgi:hypothetical protein